jgi:CBS-domain-containing membrane protein
MTTVGPQDSILTALRTMAKMRTRFLRVATGDGVTVGFVSDLEALQALVSRARRQDEPARGIEAQK